MNTSPVRGFGAVITPSLKYFAKKSKKKAAQKAKKLVAQGITPPEENSSNEMDLEALHFKHIQVYLSYSYFFFKKTSF